MAHTNSTTNYELPQFIGTDKPAWLSDFNGAMNTIDGVMKTNANNISTNASNITSISNEVGDLTQLSTTTKTDVVSAINEVNSGLGDFESYFNIVNFTTIPTTAITCSDNTMTIDSDGSLTLATNSDGSLFKLYGRLDVYVHGLATDQTISFSTSLRPTTALTINNAYLDVIYNDDNSIGSIQAFNFEIATDGTITLKISSNTNRKINALMLQPCLYFLKDFGD